MSDRIAVMDGGRVQQVAEPATLYERPRNRFVAGFIGQTNVISGKVETVNGDRVLIKTAAGAEIEALVHEEARAEAGAEAHVAVRPEKLRFGDSGDNVLPARVEQVVYLGVSTQYIMRLAGGGKLVLYQQNAHDSTISAAIGDEVTVSCDAANCLVLGE